MSAEPKRILLVEDNRADAALLQAMLEGGTVPFTITWVDRLKAALDRLADGDFDAALLDLSLPDSHGLATLERLQEAARTIPIVIVTGREDEELAITAIRQGAQDYLVKDGLTGRAVGRAVQYAIDRKHAEQALRASRDERERTFNTVPDLIAILDEHHHVVRANRAMAEKLGLTPEACVGASCYEVVHGCDSPPGICPHAQTLQDGLEHTAEVHEEHTLVATFSSPPRRLRTQRDA